MREVLPVLLAALPLPLAAEGARQVLSCQSVQSCEPGGACQPGEEAVTFTLSPLSVGPDGSGDFTIAYGDVSADMTNVSGLGPLLWSESGSDRQTLIFTGETTLLWHSLDPDTGASAIRFLSCEVTQ